MFKKNPDKALLKAAEKGQLDKVKAALDLGANIECHGGIGGDTPLTAASANHQIKTVEFLISQSANINAKCQGDGQTSLADAAKRGHYSLVKLLIEAGADPYIKDHKGKTALMLAATPEIHDYLLQYITKQVEQNIEKKTDHQDTPLYIPVNTHTVCKYQGKIKELGTLRTLFNFKSKTVTEVINETPGQSRNFYDFIDHQEILEAYDWMREKGHDIPHPFKKNAVSPFKTVHLPVYK